MTTSWTREQCRLAEERAIYTTDDIKRRHLGHWFSGEAKRFFRSRVGADVYHGRDFVYFASSEEGPDGVRRYSVRSYDLDTDRIGTVGEFQGYESRDAAHRAAAKIAADSLTD